ncbi:hypothetical protein DDF62_17520 [Caulobacter radicis]|uniref:TonB family protein n=1 Tax=Caulobacter radicis TaxID=2172650 RepID=UPI000D5863A9|nr:TonB family protein [Caulobacter radicis]PVM86853.1 hypothetical protein DDF62_17520 [Caulobacter radicis]
MTWKTTLACAAAIAALGAAHSAAAEETRDFVTRPVWARTPSVNDMHNYYPVRAGTKGGKAVLECRVDAAGAVSGCTVTSEAPTDADLGAAALKLSRLFRMKPKDAEGKPVDGRWLTLPIEWKPGRW